MLLVLTPNTPNNMCWADATRICVTKDLGCAYLACALPWLSWW